jgi:outer membrane protein TolC
MAKRAWAAVALLVATAGCSFAPAYHPPVTPAVTAFKEAGPWQPAAPADTAPRGDWWAVFSDPTLDALERKIATDNPSYAGALARYDAARG